MISYGRHSISPDDIKALTEVLQSDWLTCGPVVEKFEQMLEKTVNAKHAISCSNGTTALHLAMLSLGIGVGDIVLVPAITFLASANAARYVGAHVAFVDVDPTTGLMTSETLEAAILKNHSKNIKAVVNVHLTGHCENLEEIYKIAQKYNLFIIEDAAHAIGTSYLTNEGTRHPIGSNRFSDITTFSFHPVKTIAMGEGGAITTNDHKIAEKLKLYRSHGMIRDPHKWVEIESSHPWYYEMQELGYNYRISDINCALGLSQLKRLPEFISERSKIVKIYDDAFININYLKPLKKLKFSETAWHLYIIFIDYNKIGKSRSDIMRGLKEKGIGTQVHYIPLYKQPYYKKLYGPQTLKGAEQYYESCLTIPLFVGLSLRDQQNIIREILSICAPQ
ncbi:MAG: UDP-4-amino-4,6-dideoxy-N-acetyl-beta-L-altrosamine transaminase [Proteobacteria bacterium]|nr:UDP-4-amino-4,6-dideoxy-N-acetyl-beta-L-altrosamine transaminase [Pseudomonadota bacterium]